MKAVVKYGYGKGETEIREVPVPQIGDDDILIGVRVLAVVNADGGSALLDGGTVLGIGVIVVAGGKQVTVIDQHTRAALDTAGVVHGLGPGFTAVG